MKGYIPQDSAVCGSCAHFRQHYIRYRNSSYYVPISYGHCVYPERKRRRTEEVCAFWTARETGKT